MNTKTLTPSFFPLLILVSVLFLAACQPIGGAPFVLAQPVFVAGFPSAAFDHEQAADNQAARWVAMAEFYQKNGMLTREIDAGESAQQISLFSANPELIAAQRSAAASSLSTNPELIVAQRYANTGSEKDFPQTNVVSELDFDAAELVSGELDARDISAARQAAYYLAEVERVRHEISAADFSAARQAAMALSQTNVVGEVEFDAAELLSGELDARDISAARKAAHYLAAARQVLGELDADDIAAAREAAMALSQTNVVGEVDFDARR